MNRKFPHNQTVFITLVALLLPCSHAFAQDQTPAPQTAPSSPEAAPTAQTGSAPTPAVPLPPQPSAPQSTYPHHYLEQRIELTELGKSFYPTRAQLGCMILPGLTDKTVSSGIKFTVDQNTLMNYLEQLKPRADSEAAKAHPELVKPFVHETAMKSDNAPRPAKIVPADPSARLDVNASVKAITSSIAANPLTMSIPLSILTGSKTPASDDLTGIDARLSHFVTHFDTGEVGRTVTVRRAIQLIDGTVLQPGQIFSINGTVGERTVARGFGIGKVFINGTMEDQVGGGMCQVATTLFNAALLANLKIVERHQHVRTVPYVPAGGDATVYYGQKDFKFQNNTTAPVYIYYKTYGRFAVCDLYGKGEPKVKVKVVTTPTRLGQRYYKGVIQRFVTVDGNTINNYTAYSSYKWTPSLDYLR